MLTRWFSLPSAVRWCPASMPVPFPMYHTLRLVSLTERFNNDLLGVQLFPLFLVGFLWSPGPSGTSLSKAWWGSFRSGSPILVMGIFFCLPCNHSPIECHLKIHEYKWEPHLPPDWWGPVFPRSHSHALQMCSVFPQLYSWERYPGHLRTQCRKHYEWEPRVLSCEPSEFRFKSVVNVLKSESFMYTSNFYLLLKKFYYLVALYLALFNPRLACWPP